jgi:hypothetical protein
MNFYNAYYENLETGEVLTWDEMLKQYNEEYGGKDSKDPLGYTKYYKVTTWLDVLRRNPSEVKVIKPEF